MLDSAQAQLKGVIRKTVAAVIGFMLALVLLTALLITGFYLLVQAGILALSPLLGEATAMATVGMVCVLLLVAFFWRMTSGASPPKQSRKKGTGATSSLDELRELIRQNPLEAALAAFAIGIVQQADPRLRSLLMEGGVELMKHTQTTDSGDAGSRQTPPADPDPEN